MPIVPGLADAAWSLGALNEMHLDQRSFVDTEDAIVVEIILFDAAILERDFAPQRRR